VRGNPFDLLVMGAAGFVGFLLRRQGFPMAPLVIGMVLGPTLELTLRQGLILTDGNFLAFFTGHPIALALALTAVGALLLPVVRSLRERTAA
jgi:putative tricarboxylic transport membrane protein